MRLLVLGSGTRIILRLPCVGSTRLGVCGGGFKLLVVEHNIENYAAHMTPVSAK